MLSRKRQSCVTEDALGHARWYAWWLARSRWERLAIAAWGTILLFVSVRVFISPEKKTVYPMLSASANLWWHADELYEPFRRPDVQPGYRYSPTCAILMTPFGWLPDSLGGVLWRLLSVAAMLGALRWFERSVLPQAASAELFAWLSLATIPLALHSINNGQANILVIAYMLASVAAVADRRWTLASVLIAAAFICKLYPLALGMVLILLYPRQLLGRAAVALAASLLLPFLCQHPDYVLGQYAKWIALLGAEDRTSIPLREMYRDLWLLIHLYDLPVSRTAYHVLQVLAGAAVAGLCWHRRQLGWSTRALLTSSSALAIAWMMLLGPATESCSFVLLAPSLAWSIVDAAHARWRPRNALLWSSCVLFVLSVILGGFSETVWIHGYGIHAWATLFYVGYLLGEPRSEPVRTTENSVDWQARLMAGIAVPAAVSSEK